MASNEVKFSLKIEGNVNLQHRARSAGLKIRRSGAEVSACASSCRNYTTAIDCSPSILQLLPQVLRSSMRKTHIYS